MQQNIFYASNFQQTNFNFLYFCHILAHAVVYRQIITKEIIIRTAATKVSPETEKHQLFQFVIYKLTSLARWSFLRIKALNFSAKI